MPDPLDRNLFPLPPKSQHSKIPSSVLSYKQGPILINEFNHKFLLMDPIS